jgi:hypothetical protein
VDLDMSDWTEGELDQIASADALRLASARSDGTLRRPVTMWVVRHGGDVYVRSVKGRTSHWFRGVQDRHEGHISAGGVEKDVAFVEAGGNVNDAVDDAYRTKYRSYGPAYLDPMFEVGAREATVQLVPR